MFKIYITVFKGITKKEDTIFYKYIDGKWCSFVHPNDVFNCTATNRSILHILFTSFSMYFRNVCIVWLNTFIAWYIAQPLPCLRLETLRLSNSKNHIFFVSKQIFDNIVCTSMHITILHILNNIYRYKCIHRQFFCRVKI